MVRKWGKENGIIVVGVASLVVMGMLNVIVMLMVRIRGGTDFHNSTVVSDGKRWPQGAAVLDFCRERSEKEEEKYENYVKNLKKKILKHLHN